MQSQNSSTEEKRKPLPLPWGFGSMVFHGRVWWLTWRDIDGKVHHDNSGTGDAAEAQHIMAERALPRARAMVAQLERIAYGEETYIDPAKSKSRKRPRSRRVAPRRSAPAKPPRTPGGKA